MFQSSHANQHKSMQYESTLQCNSLLKIIFNYSISNLFRKAWRAEMHGWMVKHCRGWQVWPKKYFISTFTTHCPVSTPHPLLTQLWPLHCNALWSFPRLCICCHWCQVMRGEHQVPSCPSAKCHHCLYALPNVHSHKSLPPPNCSLAHYNVYISQWNILGREHLVCQVLPCIIRCQVSTFCLNDCI